MFTLICQIPHGRRDLFDKILPKIQVFYRRFPVLVRGQRCHPLAGFVDHPGCPIRVYNIFTGIQAIHCIFQCGIPLWNCLVRLCVFFLQLDRGIHTLIDKGMGKCHFRFAVIGVRESEGVYILLISHIPFRGLDFFHIKRKSNGQIRRKDSFSILSSHRFFNQRSLRYHDTSIRIFNIASCIQAKHAAIQRI